MTPVTLITGTRKGIGRYLAEYYVEKGHHVIGCSRGEATFANDRYDHHRVDVGDEAAVGALFRAIDSKHRRLDHLVNNAAIGSHNLALLTPVTNVLEVLQTNVVGTFLSCREAARLMARGGGGRIVNFASVAVPLAPKGSAIYSASKAAVLTMTSVLAQEFAPLGITVNTVSPNPIETDLLAGVPSSGVAKVLDRQPLPQLSTPRDVAEVIDFYLAPSSCHITGQNVFLGGIS